MGEFKDGTLKSGGSGRKVTNPKQAMAIALSEANRMNQGGIVGLAQMQSPFANSILPQDQAMKPMQRNFSQIQGQGQQPLDAYKGYLQSTYILPMQQNEVQKVNEFVDAVGQAERQFFGGQQDGKTFGGKLQPGMPGSGLKNEGGPQPSIFQPTNQAPAVMPPMNMAPAVMPEGFLEPLRMNQGGMMYSDIMNRPMFQTPQQRQGMGIMAGVAPVRGYAEGDLADKEDGTEEEGEGLFNEALAKASEMGEDAINYLQENPVEAALMFVPGLGAAGLAVKFGPKIIRGLMRGAAKSKAPQQASKQADELQVSLSPGASYNVAGAARPPVAPSAAATATTPRTLRGIMSAAPAAAAGAIRRNPGKAALAGIVAGGASTIPFGGEEITEKPPADTSTGDTGGGGDNTGDQQSGIMKFLFGSDGIGGEPGAVGKTLDYLADPKTRYALARAAESRPGVVDRNFFTDFTLGQAEYEAAQQQNQTAFMRNFETLRKIYPESVTDQEIAEILLDDSEDPEDKFLTLFKAAIDPTTQTVSLPIAQALAAAIPGYELPEDFEKVLAQQTPVSATVPPE